MLPDMSQFMLVFIESGRGLQQQVLLLKFKIPSQPTFQIILVLIGSPFYIM